jgi:AraC family transcriptional regulator
MYFTALPDHSQPGFNEQSHFNRFKKHNVIFNALSRQSHCDNHVGCLSFKTVLSGEEWYGVNHRQLAVRPGQFLILNNDQSYSCYIDTCEPVRTLSVFFKKDFASAIFHDTLNKEESLLNNPFYNKECTPEFFQTLYDVDPELQSQLIHLISSLETFGYQSQADEQLIFLLRQLITFHHSELIRSNKVSAIKSTTRKELYKRLCVAKDVLHSSYMDELDLNKVGQAACMSVPQLVRQFKSVFHTTPHQYLISIRLKHAAELLKSTAKPVSEIALNCGFENASAFSRVFKLMYRVQPGVLRKG